jgi:hypothetical protein
MARRAQDTAPAWRVWGEDVADAYRQQFYTEGARLLHSVWAPLSPKYAAWKAKHFPGKTILRRRDVMMDDFTARPMNIERVDHHSGTFGSGRKPAKWHQRGTRFMPARPIARADEELHAAARRHLLRHITHGDL